jgi:hypothetical protein
MQSREGVCLKDRLHHVCISFCSISDDAKLLAAIYKSDPLSPNEWNGIDGGLSTIAIAHLEVADVAKKQPRIIAYSVTQKV